ncbi:MAG TPA: hypothetical protein IAC24_03275 [Candidatus Onthousia faecigallinarum]|nr:hypothetical protein [Candidatus Onthousia faecigallinarum]
MASRMQRYEENSENKGARTRTSRNQELYQDLGKTEKYTTFTDVSKIEAIDLEEAKRNYHTRQGYHQAREYNFFEEEKPKVRKELDEFNYLYPKEEKKSYNLNEVLSEAKRQREKDDLERKRKLHNEKYNILESSQEDLEKFKKEVKKTIKPVENEEELEELIHTITSKELREKIDKEKETSLLSDLMATSNLDEVVEAVPEKTETQPKIEPIKKEEDKTKPLEIDKSFYTKSLDLTEEDFDDEEEGEKKKTPVILIFLKLLLSIAIIGGVGIGVYYFVTHF